MRKREVLTAQQIYDRELAFYGPFMMSYIRYLARSPLLPTMLQLDIVVDGKVQRAVFKPMVEWRAALGEAMALARGFAKAGSPCRIVDRYGPDRVVTVFAPQNSTPG